MVCLVRIQSLLIQSRDDYSTDSATLTPCRDVNETYIPKTLGCKRFLTASDQYSIILTHAIDICMVRRSLTTGAIIALDYKISLHDTTSQNEEYQAILERVHRRAAQRILDCCLRNGGLYIKLGQGLVTMNHILPKQYLDTLVVLQDKVLTRGTHEVCSRHALMSVLYTLVHDDYIIFKDTCPNRATGFLVIILLHAANLLLWCAIDVFIVLR